MNLGTYFMLSVIAVILYDISKLLREILEYLKMEIMFKPRRYGQAQETIEYISNQMRNGRGVFMACTDKSIQRMEAVIIALFYKGHYFALKEEQTILTIAIWDKDRFEPSIIGYKNEIKFNGYTFNSTT